MTNATAGYDLTGRVAVLTGAGSGIGKATALTLAGAGATIVGGDIDVAAVTATAEEISAAGGTARAVSTDVTSRAQVDALVDGAQAEFGRVDIMGNIAGIPQNKMVMDCTDDEFERILSINLKSCFYGCQAAMRVMAPRESGNIINISSGAIDTPAPTLACYGMTKAAVAMLTKTLACEAGPLGIRVNALAPGVIHTNFSRHNFVDDDGTSSRSRWRATRSARAMVSLAGCRGKPLAQILFPSPTRRLVMPGYPAQRRRGCLVGRPGREAFPRLGVAAPSRPRPRSSTTQFVPIVPIGDRGRRRRGDPPAS
jgi:3-oxoacyl-[acyl-carrier protein] reductase